MSISRAFRYPSRSNTLRAAATNAARVGRPRSVAGGSRSSDDRAIDGGESVWSAGSSLAATLTMCTVIRHRVGNAVINRAAFSTGHRPCILKHQHTRLIDQPVHNQLLTTQYRMI